MFGISFLGVVMMMGVIGSSMAKSQSNSSDEKVQPRKPSIKKLDTIDCDMVETTTLSHLC